MRFLRGYTWLQLFLAAFGTESRRGWYLVFAVGTDLKDYLGAQRGSAEVAVVGIQGDLPFAVWADQVFPVRGNGYGYPAKNHSIPPFG